MSPRSWIFSFLLGTLLAGSFAKAAPWSMTYQGTLTDASDLPLANQTQSVTFSIYNPALNCLLYQETQSVTTDSNGVFSVNVGTASGSGLRTANDPGLSMTSVFEGQSGVIVRSSGSNCSSSYVTGSNDVRYLRVNVAGTDLSPDLAISSVPFALQALNAEKLSGVAASSFALLNTTAPAALSQSNLENIFSTTNYVKLTSLLAGTSTSYVQQTANGSLQAPSISGTPSSPTAGQVWYDSGVLKYWNGSTAQTLGTSGGTAVVSDSASLTSGKIWIGDSGGLAREKSLNGDVTISNTGFATVTGLRGTTMSSTTPSTTGQIIRYNGSQWEPAFLSMADLRSNTTGFQSLTSCSLNQTLYFNTVTDNLSCGYINIDATQVVSGALPVEHGGTGSTTGSIFGLGALTIAAGGGNQNISIVPSGTGSTIFTGNVGIGTSAPSSGLQVVGLNASIPAATVGSGISNANNTALYAYINSIHSSSSVSDIGLKVAVTPTISGVSAGASGLQASTLRAKGGLTDSGTLTNLYGADISYGHYSFGGSSPTTASAYGIRIMPYIMSGTVTDMYDLYLGSDITGSGSVTNRYGIYQANTSPNIFKGKIGVGTSSPEYPLDVVSTSPSAVARFKSTAASPDPVVIFEGNTNTSCSLSTSGNLSCSSDVRLKKDIQPIFNALDGVLSLDGVQYHMNDEDSSSPLHIGFKAQQIKEIFPQVVTQDKNGYYQVSYGPFVAVLVEAIKEIHERVTEENQRKDQQIRDLQQRLDDQQRLLEQLKSRLDNQ